MGEYTGIEWAKGPHKKGATWNPWRGCKRISPACAHCYMFRDQARYGLDPNTVVRTGPGTFHSPTNWKEPHGIFTCSWSDFFIEQADPWREDAYEIMKETPRHTYLVLTKRPERFAGHLPASQDRGNMWLGVSVENNRFYGRIDLLRDVYVPIRFLSIEPLLGPMPDIPLEGINWVIIGGESGPNFRPFNLDWAREIRDKCQDLGIPFFLKQKSAVNPKRIDRLLDGRTWDEIPK